MDNYYTKYLKYKNKYLELKRANSAIINGESGSVGDGVIRGGFLGTEQCPETFGLLGLTTKSVWSYLRKYNCTYDKLFEKIPSTVNAITYADFKRSNNEHLGYQQITIKDLLNRGFPVEFLREKGFLEGIKKELKVREILYYLYDAKYIENTTGSLEKIKNYKFTIDDFKNSFQHTYALYLKRARYSATELKNVGINAFFLKLLGFTFQQLKDAGFTFQQLKDAGFNAEELKKAGFTIRSLVTNMGYTLQELKEIGFSATEFKDEKYSPDTLYSAGFSLKDLKSVGFSAIELVGEEITDDNIIKAGFTIDEINKARYLLDKLKKNVPLSDLKKEGVTATELKAAWISAEKLKPAGYSAEELKDAGYSAEELKKAGYSAEELKKAGIE